jgi:hypothetical protein
MASNMVMPAQCGRAVTAAGGSGPLGVMDSLMGPILMAATQEGVCGARILVQFPREAPTSMGEGCQEQKHISADPLSRGQ